VLERVARNADGYFCSTSALANFAAIWDKIVSYTKANGRDPNGIEKARLNFLGIDDDKNRAVGACDLFSGMPSARWADPIRGGVECLILSELSPARWELWDYFANPMVASTAPFRRA
jgi:alkanesulfonate monooxygenase SsuD/methylene tetrahydromethanopterin reductase-like flavin-dependent oxidoreductase (luciferase family)